MINYSVFPVIPSISDTEHKAAIVNRVWSNYVNKGIVVGHVRTFVLNSWKRSQSYGVDPNMLQAPVVLSKSEIDEGIKRNEELLSVIRPFIYELYEIVKGTNSVLAFSDSSSIVMEVFGDKQIVKAANSVNFRVGADMKEETVGANSIGTSLKLRMPIQMFGAEHFSRLWHESNCSSSPIIDPFSDQIIGVITIIGYYSSTHPHSLALVTSASNAISRIIQQRGLEKEKLLLNNYFYAALESVSDGILVVNRRGEVVSINRVASHLLRIPLETDYKYILQNFDYLEPLKKFIAETVGGSDIITQKEYQTSKEDRFNILFTSRRIVISEECIGAIILLKKKLVTEVYKGTTKYTFASLIGENKEFLKAIQLAKKSALTDKSVLILGESGTGKELFAQAIHNASSRAHERFIAINCAALPRELMASELFGYTEGSFTGALKGGRKGKFEEAHGGTVFLDEIGDMPLDLQAYLLRVLEEREVTPIGSNQSKSIDIRIIAATHKNLYELVTKGEFRLDLFYRLNVITIDIPSLRQRIQDIDLFATRYLPNKSLSPEVMQIFYHYDWPGNLRELRNVLEQIDIFCEEDVVTTKYIPQHIRIQTEKYVDNMPLYKVLTKEMEKDSIIRILKSSNSVTEAASKLEASVSTLYRWINKFEINPKEYLIT